MTNFMKPSLAGAAFALAALCGAALPVAGQSIADRVARVSSGSVRMSFATRPGICGGGSTIYHGSGGRTSWDDNRRDSSRDVEWDSECSHGPARLVIDRSGGQITALRFYVGGRWRPGGADVTDLGMVSAREAANYLVSVAQNDRGSIGSKAILPATMADSADVWPALMRVARNPDVPRGTRNQAVFWIGQAAGEKVTADLGALVVDNSVDREIREQAVFALSQRPRDQSVPALINVARTNRDPEIRKKALFWLGQSHDPRALDLFEELLTKR